MRRADNLLRNWGIGAFSPKGGIWVAQPNLQNSDPHPSLSYLPFGQNFLQVDTFGLEAECDIQSQLMDTLMASSSSSLSSQMRKLAHSGVGTWSPASRMAKDH